MKNLLIVFAVFFGALAVSCSDNDVVKDSGPMDAAIDMPQTETMDMEPDLKLDIGQDTKSDGDQGLLPDTSDKCDPTKFKPYCSEKTKMVICKNDVYDTFDCTSTPNFLCADIDGEARCVATDDTTGCYNGKLSPCLTLGNDDFAFVCDEVGTLFVNYFSKCDHGCKNDPSGSGFGYCFPGPPCAGSASSCNGDTLTACINGYLYVEDCLLASEKCTASTLNNGQYRCHPTGQSSCNPSTYKASCTNNQKGITCESVLGLTLPFTCPTGQHCCVDSADGGTFLVNDAGTQADTGTPTDASVPADLGLPLPGCCWN
ncbi:MAG: hypothetical protein V1754_05730 [Pseudomonadota bacterium]